MLDKILSIDDNEALIRLKRDTTLSTDLMNILLVFDDGDIKILSEVCEIRDLMVRVEFLGEFNNNYFIPGIIRKPKLNSDVRLVSTEELDILLSSNDNESFSFGDSVLYDRKLNINIDSLFSNHLAIFGNTGSGKTYGVAKMIQSLFDNPNNIALNSAILLFDTHGEYHSALKDIPTINPLYKIKHFSTNQKEGNLINLPIWLLDIEDIAYLLGATDYTQLTIIEKTLYVLSVISQRDELARKYKNHIIAKSIQSIMYSSKSPTLIRSQVFELLSICSTEDINLDINIQGIGYTRAFQKCFDINKNGTFAENLLLSNFIERFINEEYENEKAKPIKKCNLEDLEDALNFVIISTEIINNEHLYDKAAILKMRLHSLIIKGYGKYFDYHYYVTLEEFIGYLLTEDGKTRVQVVDFNIEGLTDHFTSFITRIYCKLVHTFAVKLKQRAAIPIHIFLEEAHRFVSTEDRFKLGSDLFETIAKEGRKYGIILTLISQRPTELSETVLSQCSSFLLYRTNHPRDLEFMKRAIPDINTDIIDKQRSLQPGYCIGVGKAFKIPLVMKLDYPNPTPESSNAKIYNIWSGKF